MSLVAFKAQNHPQQRGKDSVDDRGTDPALFVEWHRRFRFTIDVAASAVNAKLPRYYTRLDDGLTKPWAGERVWCNPPYSSIAPWVRKAHDEPAALVVMLLPANRTEQRWWQQMIEPYRDNGGRLSVEFLAGRPRFVNAGKTDIGPNERPPFGCCLCIWQPTEAHPPTPDDGVQLTLL